LYASIAAIATAQINTANIISADIHWADIEALATETAQIAKAQITAANIDEANIDWASITTLTAAFAAITNASIGTADIDWAHIKDLATDTAIITRGVGGKLYIADLAVTEANMVSLTVGDLVVKGEDGHFYSVSVDGEGNVVSALKQIGNSDVADVSINAGEKIIEGTVTAATLNAQDIFADSAIIRSLIAANLDVDTLFAREATIAALNAADITGNEYLRLMVAGKADAGDVGELAERVSQAELKITDTAIVSTVTSSDAYQQAQQQIYTDMDALLGYRVEIVAGTVFLTETVRSTTLTARVWHGKEDMTSSIPAASFRWKRESADPTADTVWNDAHVGLKTILVTTADILRQATFCCDLVEE
jgi:hypothetical protein